jgi:hypothetical protein
MPLRLWRRQSPSSSPSSSRPWGETLPVEGLLALSPRQKKLVSASLAPNPHGDDEPRTVLCEHWPPGDSIKTRCPLDLWRIPRPLPRTAADVGRIEWRREVTALGPFAGLRPTQHADCSTFLRDGRVDHFHTRPSRRTSAEEFETAFGCVSDPHFLTTSM